MSGEKSLDSFDEVNAFTITVETDDADRDAITDALADRDEWEATVEDDTLHVRGAGTEDGLRNLLQALTDIDPDALTITDADDEDDADEAAEDSDDALTDDIDDVDEDAGETESDDADEADMDAEEEPADETEMDDGTAAEDDDTADDALETADDTDTDEEAAEDAPVAVPDDTDSPDGLLAAYMEQHGATVTDADTTLDTLDLNIDTPDDLLDLLQLEDETAFIAAETGYDEDTVETLLDTDQDDLEAELEEVNGLIEQLETVKETGEDQLSALQPDDIDAELEQLQEKQDDLTEQLEQVEAVQDTADRYAALADQADRLEAALANTAGAVDALEFAVIDGDDTATVRLPSGGGSPGALTAVVRTRLTAALDAADAVSDYTVTPDDPVTTVAVEHDATLPALQELVHDAVTGDTPDDLSYTVHAYSVRTGGSAE